jgi:xanthine dehydrogenase accessory factor
MKELGEIAALWRTAEKAREEAILATVVDVSGSSYRRPGGRLLLTKAGRRVGSISGGCLEGDLAKKAWWLTETGAVVRKYDTSADDDGPLDYGLGCNGLIHILIERLRPGTAVPIIDVIERTRSSRRAATVATVIRSTDAVLIGMRVCLLPDGEELASTAPPQADSRKAEEVKAWLRSLVRLDVNQESPAGRADESLAGRIECHPIYRLEVFVETLAPPPRLWVFGAGDDVLPMVQQARMLGWPVVVLDGRSHFARAGRFPPDVEVVLNSLDEPLAGLTPDQWTVAAVMSHSFSQDQAAVQALAPLHLPYVGVLGPKRRTQTLLMHARLSPELLTGNWHSPAGLDLGGDTPEQVALSIAAEVQAVLLGRDGGKIRERPGPIHGTDMRSGEEIPFAVRPLACT